MKKITLMLLTALLCFAVADAQSIKVDPKKKKPTPAATAAAQENTLSDTTFTLKGSTSIDTTYVKIIYYGDDGGEYKPFVWGFGYLVTKNVFIPSPDPTKQGQTVPEWRKAFNDKRAPIDWSSVYDVIAFDWRKVQTKDTSEPPKK